MPPKSSLLAIVVTMACASDDYEPPPDDAGMRAYAEASCAASYACECEERPFFDEADCIDNVFNSLRGGQIDARVANLTYDDDCIQTRVGLFESLGCTPVPDPLPISPCQIFYGDRQVGEPCENVGLHMSDCAEGLRCSGRCYDPDDPTTYPTLAEGETCLENSIVLGLCPEATVCSPTNRRCTRVANLGESCGGLPFCNGGYCDTDTCTAWRADGEACSAHEQCVEVCADGVCGPATVPLACFSPLL